VTLADQPTARHVLAEIDDVLAHRPDLEVLVELWGLRGLLGTPVRDTIGAGPPSPRESSASSRTCRRTSASGRWRGLFLSCNTVATRVGSIYRKLGVSPCSAAVERATTVGLLGG